MKYMRVILELQVERDSDNKIYHGSKYSYGENECSLVLIKNTVRSSYQKDMSMKP